MFFPKLVQDMAAAGCVVTCVILLSLWPNCVLPQEQEVSSLRPEENPFDVGPINSCQVPQTTFCSMVTYEVPAPIAKLTDFIEMEIRSTVEDPADDQEEVQECMEVYKETLCRKQFPRCSAQDNLVYFEAVENCEERLRNLCPDVASAVIKLEYCSSTQLNLYSGSCRRLSSYNNTLQHCNLLERDILVSDWMYERIRQVDLKLQQEFGLSYLSSQPDCWQKYRNFQCGAVGECVGDRTQLINSREACEAVLNCYSDDTEMILAELLSCQPWPSQSVVSPPVAIVSVNSHQPAFTASSISGNGWMQPIDRTFEFSSSARTYYVWSIFTVIISLYFAS